MGELMMLSYCADTNNSHSKIQQLGAFLQNLPAAWFKTILTVTDIDTYLGSALLTFYNISIFSMGKMKWRRDSKVAPKTQVNFTFLVDMQKKRRNSNFNLTLLH